MPCAGPTPRKSSVPSARHGGAAGGAGKEGAESEPYRSGTAAMPMHPEADAWAGSKGAVQRVWPTPAGYGTGCDNGDSGQPRSDRGVRQRLGLPGHAATAGHRRKRRRDRARRRCHRPTRSRSRMCRTSPNSTESKSCTRQRSQMTPSSSGWRDSVWMMDIAFSWRRMPLPTAGTRNQEVVVRGPAILSQKRGGHAKAPSPGCRFSRSMRVGSTAQCSVRRPVRGGAFPVEGGPRAPEPWPCQPA